jgi:hypothetical protein
MNDIDILNEAFGQLSVRLDCHDHGGLHTREWRMAYRFVTKPLRAVRGLETMCRPKRNSAYGRLKWWVAARLAHMTEKFYRWMCDEYI